MNFALEKMSDFKLHLSNERIEQELAQDEPSSASYFDAIINPSLDLSFLTFLRSNDVELSLDNFTISSAALTFRRDEKIRVYLDIPSNLSGGNWCYTKNQQAQHNIQALSILIEDFTTSNSKDALDYINGLIGSKVNSFLLIRYLTMICDEELMFQPLIFSTDQTDDLTFSLNDLNLMRRYLDCSIFARMAVISTISRIIHPKIHLSAIMDTDIPYANRVFAATEESRVLAESQVLNNRENRAEVRTHLIDLNEFSGVPLTGKSGEPERTELSNKIRSRFTDYLNIIGFTSPDEPLTPENQIALENLMQAHIELVKLGQKTAEILTMEIQRHSSKKKVLSSLTPDFIQIKVDQSQQKCHFTINHDRLAAGCQLSCFFPHYMSYRLGASKNPSTGQFETVQIGPISELTPIRDANTPRTSNKITYSFQRLGNNLRVQPKLLCIATDLLAQNSRLQELDIIFTNKSDFVSFFSQKYLPSDTDLNFLSKNHHADVAFYKIDRARNILNGFKILIQDENCQKMYFPRDTICNMSIGFQSSPLLD